MESETVNVRMPGDMVVELDQWAVEEQRTRSQMIRVLLVEALAERKRIRAVKKAR